MIKKIFIILFLITCASARAEVIDFVIAAVNGEPITLSALENELHLIGSSDTSLENRRKVLEELINRKLMLQRARKYGYDKKWAVTEDDIRAEVAKLTGKFPSEQLFRAWLEKSGMEIDDIIEDRKEYIMVANMMERELRNTVRPISDDDAVTYYEQHKNDFFESERVRMRQVQVLSRLTNGEEQRTQARALADKIWSQLNSGADFAALKKMYAHNDKIVIVQESDSVVKKLISALQGATARLKVGELSQPIETALGFFIIQITEKKPARQRVFKEVLDEIKPHLIAQQIAEKRDAWLKKQRESADIRILNTELARVKLPVEHP